MRLLLAVLSIILLGSIQSFGWEFQRDDRISCSASTLLDGPVDANILLISEVSNDRVDVHLAIRFSDRDELSQIGDAVDVAFVADSGAADLAKMELFSIFTTSFISYEDPPQSLIDKLKTLPNFSVIIEGFLQPFALDLAGSKAAINRYENCTEDLVASTTSPDLQPSFDCDLARSVSEKLICADPDLASLDRQLKAYYEAAKRRAEKSSFLEGAPGEPAAWFADDTDTEWKWREENCHDKACLVRWYVKRRALLQWIAESYYGLGDSGISGIRQFENGDTIISYGMATYSENVIWKVSEGKHMQLPDGDIVVVSEEPFFYKVLWQKAYFKGGGAFWYDTLRDGKNTIIDILRPLEGESCMAREAFFAKTNFPKDLVDRVTADDICFHS